MGFIVISLRRNVEIYIDELTGNKYLLVGHDYYEPKSYTSGLTQMLDENGKPERYTREQIEYLKSKAMNINDVPTGAAYQHLRNKRKEPSIAYQYFEF